ncbi:hypothetical protein MMC11_005828 [Xylographa trunciseda]|nr:hypothetical protein [Xylographa trunciseda]
MDPLSMTVAISSLVMTCASIVKAAQDVRGRYKAATLTISSIAAECVAVSTALSLLQNLSISGNGSVDADVVNTLETVVIGCTLTISVLHEYILELITDNNVLKSADAKSKWRTKVKFLWNEVEMKELLLQLRGHQSSITLLLTVLRSKSEVETRELLRRNHGSLKLMISRARSSREKKTTSILEGSSRDLLDSQSVLSFAESIQSTTSFEFDDMIVNSKVYRQAMLRSIHRNASGDERNSIVEQDPVFERINPEASDTSDALGPTVLKEDLNPQAHQTVIELSGQSVSSNALHLSEDNETRPSSSLDLLKPLQLPEINPLDLGALERFGSVWSTGAAPRSSDTLISHDEHSSRQLHPLTTTKAPKVDTKSATKPSLPLVKHSKPRSKRACRACGQLITTKAIRALGHCYHIECFKCRVSIKSFYICH